jgi:type II restriction/modification system DNA methylase subunit YeeA
MTASDFIKKWQHVELKERSAAQEHFIDLCRLVGHPTPVELDPTGDCFCFERGVSKHGGGEGFADVWKRGFFGWEYKGKHKDLNAAYNQLLLYRDALESPPLLVLCDLDRIIVHTNFTNTASARHEIQLAELGEPRNLEILRALFFSPDKLRPGQTSEAVTKLAAEKIADIAESMRKRNLDAQEVAHFLDRVVFCMFAEDIGLLPAAIFTRIAQTAAKEPERFCLLVATLFKSMSTGGDFGVDRIKYFNGSLFDQADVPDLTADEVSRIVAAVRLDWSAVDPTIFGTLFERGLDPAKRAQLGAHFTGREDILLLVNAVVMEPLRREWVETREIVSCLLDTGKKKRDDKNEKRELNSSALKKARMESSSLLHGYLVRLQSVKVLDPACGSGNFLYVTLQALKDLEKEVIVFSMDNGLGSFIPLVGPWQLYGIELNPYAHDLAQMTVWIGWLQWLKFNGFGSPQEPILRAIPGNFQCRDAIMTVVPPKDAEKPSEITEPDWPVVDFIVGNPPFLGDKLMRRELGDTYVGQLRKLYIDRIPGQSDLCCYWFEKARVHIENGKCKRAGLLATQGIRGGANREVLKRIKESGNIFWAMSDREWVLCGANVHISMIAFDNGKEHTCTLDGELAPTINANLSSTSDLGNCKRLPENTGFAFIGVSMHGPFDITDRQAKLLLLPAGNPLGNPNSDVIRPILNAKEMTKREESRWVITFPPDMKKNTATYYQAPFEIVEKKVKPIRDLNNRSVYRERWWIHGEARPALFTAISRLERFIVTPRVSKHRIFIWCSPEVVPSDAVVAFAYSDDYSFGVLHSHIHEVWALRMGTRLETRPRYTPTTCFETFPFPVPTEEQRLLISEIARELNELRERWLNPPEWTTTEILDFPATVDGPWRHYIIEPGEATTLHESNEGWTPRDIYEADRSVRLAQEAAHHAAHYQAGIGNARYPLLVPRDEACAKRLKDRTLTKLYNTRPQWLADCHARLDAAVASAYGFPPDLTDDQILASLLELNHEKAEKV